MITNFTSIKCLIFFLIMIVFMRLASSRRSREWVLLGGSLIFVWLSVNNMNSFLALMGFVVMGWLCARVISYKPLSFPWLMAILVATYIVFKKYAFLALIPGGEFLINHPFMSLGVSFIIFRLIAFAIHTPGEGLLSCLAYCLNFTTFLAGPVQGPHVFSRELEKPSEKMDVTAQLQCLSRLTTGMIKKYVLCELLIVHSLPDTYVGEAYTGGQWLLRCNVYFLYLYLDFSGYCDIVISVARLMGINLPENFDFPLRSKNLIEFWQRWHISVSQWLQNYIHTPLTKFSVSRFGTENIKLFSLTSIFITFFLIGLWHGNTWNFIIFGLTQGCGILVLNLWQDGLKKYLSKSALKKYKAYPLRIILSVFITLQYMALSLSLVRLDGNQWIDMLARIF